MLEIVIGGAGTGKTAEITERIRLDLGAHRRAFLIVPEQETVASELRMLELLPPSSCLDLEILNFSRLANLVFRKYGGLTYNYVQKNVRSLAAWNAVRMTSPVLREYASHGHDASFSELMLSAIEEFKAYSVTPIMLETAMKREGTSERLCRKLYDLSLIYSVYEDLLSKYGRSDGADDITKLAEALSSHDFFEGANVYIDSFMSFTGAENEVISHIIRQAEHCVVTLCLERDGMQFDTTRRTLGVLERLAEKSGKEVKYTYLSENMRAKKPSLAHLSKKIWHFERRNDRLEDDGGTEFIKTLNSYEEAEAVSARIAELVRGGMRYRDIAVIARNADDYAGILDTALEKNGIPFFMSLPSPIGSGALPRLIMSALRIKNRGFSAENLTAYVKTGLCGTDEREADLFCDYISRLDISGKKAYSNEFDANPERYSEPLSEKSRARLEIINAARVKIIEPLLEFHAELDAAKTNRELCRAIFEHMKRLGTADAMRALAARQREGGDASGAEETLRLYNTMLDLLGVLAEFDTDGERYTADELERALGILFSHTELGSIPTSRDEVTVGSASLLRAGAPKCVIMIGVNEGVFPAAVRESEILSDEDRRALAESGIELSGDSNIRASEELFYVYRAISAPSELLIMTYPASSLRGGELKPSAAYERAMLLAGGTERDFSKLPAIERPAGRNAAFEYISETDGGDDAERYALMRYFEEREEYAEALASLKIPVYDRNCRMSARVTDRIFGKDMSISPSAFEKYIGCPFDYYCENVLRIRDDEKLVFRSSDSGTLIHSVLEKYVKRLTDTEIAENDVDSDELIRDIADEEIAAMIPARDAERESVKHRFSKLRELSALIAKNITEELKKSGFKPAHFELKIGTDGRIEPLRADLGDGRTASVRGVVDRADILRAGDDVYVKVVDYKTGSKELSLSDIKSGRGLQMLFYLFTLTDERNKRFFGCPNSGRLIPAGVIYLSSKLPREELDPSAGRDEAIGAADKALKRSGVLLADKNVIESTGGDLRYVISGCNRESDKKKYFKTPEEFEEIKKDTMTALTENIKRLRSGDAGIYPTEDGGRLRCEYCRMKPVCRTAKKADRPGGAEDPDA